MCVYCITYPKIYRTKSKLMGRVCDIVCVSRKTHITAAARNPSVALASGSVPYSRSVSRQQSCNGVSIMNWLLIDEPGSHVAFLTPRS